MNSFEERYKKLNPAQKEAVDTIDGPVMVVAGPGTGKTEILTLRIANILKQTDTPADAILALTFTEAAAANMRRRLVALVGSKGYYVQIATFHGFANQIIQEHPDKFPHIARARSATQVDQISIVRKIIDSKNWDYLAPFGDKYLYVSNILGGIRDAKREHISPSVLLKRCEKETKETMAAEDLYHEKGAYKGKMKGEYSKRLESLSKAAEFAKIYEAYIDLLSEEKMYDFDDMILEVLGAFERDENLLLEMQEKCQYVLVDEHQDTNGAQNQLLEKLMSFHDNPNIFVVGDEKQAIFRFQGASLENFLYFKTKYPSVRLITLTENYRSTQTILDSAHSVIEQNGGLKHAELKANTPAALKKIAIRSFSEEMAENLFVADLAEEKIKSGVSPQEIAVLYRDNKDALRFADVLERRGIPFVVESDQDILRDSEIKKFLLLLEAINQYGNDELFAEALHIDFLKIDPLDLYKLIELREHRSVSVARLARSKEALQKIGIENPDSFVAISEKFAEWRKRSKNEAFLNFFERVMEESGFLAHLLAKPGYISDIGRLNTLFDEARKLVGENGNYRLSEFVEHIHIFREHGAMIKSKPIRVPSAVRLMTAHKAKGLEFDVVLITGLTNGHWGNRHNRSKLKLPIFESIELSGEEKNEDERRLFYVALTRARHECFVTYSNHRADGGELIPSQFVGEIRPELCDVAIGAEQENKLKESPALLVLPRKNPGPSLGDKEFLADLFTKRGLNATALNNYLKCPWKYFYDNLIRIPKVQSKHQIYGTAVHFALQGYFEMKKVGEDVGLDFILERYESSVSRAPMKERDRIEILEKGKQTLSAYFKRYVGEWNYNTLNEFSISGVEFEDVVKLSGKLDKLEFLDAPKEICVIDYKTKKPISRNAIEGSTKDSDGAFKRQLVFYKLLLDLYPENKFIMRGAGIDFIEPNDNGIFKKEIFEIGDGEVEELKEVIRRVSKEIKDLAFWSLRCEEKDCEYCALRDMMNSK